MTESKRILIIEDDAELQELYQDFLGTEYILDSCFDIPTALNALQTTYYHCILLDLHIGDQLSAPIIQSLRFDLSDSIQAPQFYFAAAT